MQKIFIYCLCIGFAFSNSTYKAIGQTIPDSALFAKEHPSPSVVRGFMVSGRGSQEDYDDIRSWGANVIRLQVHPARYATREGKEFWAALPS